MKLKILGSSSSGNCYLLKNKEETLMIECGLPYKEILKGLDFNLHNVVGVLASHLHFDHCKAVNDLIKLGVSIYANKETFDYLKVSEVLRHTIESEYQFKAGNFTVLPFSLQHDVPNLGFLIQCEGQKVLYITDTYFCKYKFLGLTHILIECNYSKEILQKNVENGLSITLVKRLIKSHFSLENVKQFLKTNDLSECKDITLLHLSDANSNAEQFKNEIERLTGIPVYVADKGLEIEL